MYYYNKIDQEYKIYSHNLNCHKKNQNIIYHLNFTLRQHAIKLPHKIHYVNQQIKKIKVLTVIVRWQQKHYSTLPQSSSDHTAAVQTHNYYARTPYTLFQCTVDKTSVLYYRAPVFPSEIVSVHSFQTIPDYRRFVRLISAKTDSTLLTEVHRWNVGLWVVWRLLNRKRYLKIRSYYLVVVFVWIFTFVNPCFQMWFLMMALR